MEDKDQHIDQSEETLTEPNDQPQPSDQSDPHEAPSEVPVVSSDEEDEALFDDAISTAPVPETTRTPTALEDVKAHIKALDVVLSKTSKASRKAIFLEGGLWFFAALCAWVISGLMFALIAPQLRKVGILVPLSVGFVVIGIAGVVSFVWFLRHKPKPLVVARDIQSHQPSWRNDLVSSMIFGQQILSGEFDPTASKSLATAHIGQTIKRVLSEVQQGHLAHLLPRRDVSPAAISVATALILLLVPTLIAPDWVWTSFVGSQAKTNSFFSQEERKTPLTGSLSLTYQYPKYSGLRARRELFTTGDVRGLQGTEVTLDTFSLIKGSALRSLEFVIKTEKGEQAREVSIARDRRISTRFVLSESGTYFFRAKSRTGTMFVSPKSRLITVIPDKKPRIQVLSHKGTIEVSPKDVLEIKYSVEDDFGLTLIQKSHQFTATKFEPKRSSLDIPALQNKPTQYQGSFKLDLSQWDLQPKDSVVFRLEATDNNTLTGPSVGASEPIIFVVSSPDDKHLKNLSDQQAVVEALVDVLAGFLEAPVGRRELQPDETYKQVLESTDAKSFGAKLKALNRAHVPLGDVLKQMGAVTARLKEDPLMIPRDLAMFEALYVQLNDLYQSGHGLMGKALDMQKIERVSPKTMRRVALYAGDMERVLEKGILKLEDLLVSQKMESIKATTKEIKKLKERLKSLLNQYKDSKDPALKQAIKREIQRLRQRMAEMMQRMQMQTKRLPKEHVNMEALKNAQMQSDSKKLVDNFQDIEQLLEKDDIDGALKALDQMTKNLDSMTQEMNQDFQNSQPARMQEFDKKVAKLMDDVNDLSALQEDVKQKTKKLQKQLMKEQSNAMNQQMQETTKALLKKVAEQKKELEKVETKQMTAPNQASINRLKQRLSRLEKSLKQQDVDQGLKDAKRWLNEMESLRFSMQLAQRYVRRPSARFDRLRDNLRQIRPMNKRGEEIVEDLQDLMDDAQRQQAKSESDPRAKKLSEQQAKVQEQAKKLEQRIQEASKQYPTLQQKMKGDMQKAQKGMEEAKKNLGQRKMQSALDAERQTLESLRKMKKSMKNALKNQRTPQDGKSNQSRQEVEIPGQTIDENKAYRDNIKKGMKEERLKNYASDIESYYKSLVE